MMVFAKEGASHSNLRLGKTRFLGRPDSLSKYFTTLTRHQTNAVTGFEAESALCKHRNINFYLPSPKSFRGLGEYTASLPLKHTACRYSIIGLNISQSTPQYGRYLLCSRNGLYDVLPQALGSWQRRRCTYTIPTFTLDCDRSIILIPL